MTSRGGTYGWPRVHGRCAARACTSAGQRVARMIATAGLIGRCRRQWTKTTDLRSRRRRRSICSKRAFGPGTVELDRVYVGDITYVWTWEGWLYLATVIDLSSRRVSGLGDGRSHASRVGLRRPGAWPSTSADPRRG